MFRLGEALHGGPATPNDVERLQEKLLFDRMPVKDRLVRFFVLIFLSTVIAAYGVVADSTATVIGAMIVAPMMTPITAISLSVITGDSRNMIRSFLIVVGGTALVIVMSLLLAGALPGSIQVLENSQVTSRVSPRLIDLVIALAAGAAGSFATSREDVSDALPGVAIAVSLVPPLAVVGITLSARAYRQAWGAMLLFLTNFLAIVAAGLIVFAIMGYGGAALGEKNHRARKYATVAIIIAILIIAVPLGLSGYNVTHSETVRRKAKNAVDEWIEGTDYDLIKVEVDVSQLDAAIAGDGELPDLDELLSILNDKGVKKKVEVRVVPEKTLKGDSGKI